MKIGNIAALDIDYLERANCWRDEKTNGAPVFSLSAGFTSFKNMGLKEPFAEGSDGRGSAMLGHSFNWISPARHKAKQPLARTRA